MLNLIPLICSRCLINLGSKLFGLLDLINRLLDKGYDDIRAPPYPPPSPFTNPPSPQS